MTKNRIFNNILLTFLVIGAILSATKISEIFGNISIGIAIFIGGLLFINLKEKTRGILIMILSILIIVLGFY